MNFGCSNTLLNALQHVQNVYHRVHNDQGECTVLHQSDHLRRINLTSSTAFGLYQAT